MQHLDAKAQPQGAITDYDNLRSHVIGTLASFHGTQSGDPEKFGSVLVDLVFGEGLTAGKEFPLALTMGYNAVQSMKELLKEDMDRVAEWEEVSCSTEFET